MKPPMGSSKTPPIFNPILLRMREVICLILPRFEKSVEFGHKNEKTGIVGKVP